MQIDPATPGEVVQSKLETKGGKGDTVPENFKWTEITPHFSEPRQKQP
jgi:hypothetical protein